MGADDLKSSKKQGTPSSRELRRLKREGLRSKSTGVGLSIDISEDTGKSNKKIVFDEKVDLDLDHAVEKDTEKAAEQEDGSDSDDDAIEEVKGNVAKEEAKKQRTTERAVARASTDLKANKRKRKSRLEKTEVDTEDFDDDFFDKLDAEMDEQREKKKRDQKSSEKSGAPSGRHTTFLADAESSLPVKVDGSIEVVVLSDDPLQEGTASMQVSNTAMLFSRSQLVDGHDIVSEKQARKAKKAGQDVLRRTSTWNRSKKMNRLLLPGAQNSRRKGEGVAASHFVVKM